MAAMDYERQKAALRRINLAIANWEGDATPPRADEAFLTAVSIGFPTALAQVIALALTQAEVSLMQFIALPLGLAVLVGMIRYATSSTPRTHEGMIDRLLTQYNPVDASALQLLQRQILDRGYLEIDSLKAWAEREARASEANHGRLALNAFAERQL